MTIFRLKYVWPYLLFCGSLVVAAYANIKTISAEVEQNRWYASVINLAGKQRYLSQKCLTNYIGSYSNIPGGTIDNRDLQYWKQSHNQLIGLCSSNKIVEVEDSLRNLSPLVDELYNAFMIATTQSVVASNVTNVTQQQKQYFQRMNNVVNLLQSRDELALEDLRKKHTILSICSVLLLILEILILVVPYHKKLIVSYHKLKENKILIEAQSKEIQHQLTVLTESKGELEKLYNREELTLDGINAGIWAWDISTGEENWSPNFYRVLGYEPGELVSSFDTFLNVLLHPDDKALVVEAVDAHLSKGVDYHVEIRMLNKDGNYRWYDASGKASKDPTGKPLTMAGSIIDIHEKISYRQKLENSNTAKNKIFAILSHELKSPLTSMKGILELYNMGELTPEEFAEYVGRINDSINFAIKTLDNVLIWASSQMSIIKGRPVCFKLADTFKEVEEFHRYFASQKGINISFSCDDTLEAFADPNHIFIIARNLVANAIKFTEKGGAVSITGIRNNDSVEVRVKDSGIGMTSDKVKIMLSSGDYGSTYGTNGEKGTGLGINLIQELLKLNSGKLFVESTVGEGSTFSFIIPANSAQNVSWPEQLFIAFGVVWRL